MTYQTQHLDNFRSWFQSLVSQTVFTKQSQISSFSNQKQGSQKNKPKLSCKSCQKMKMQNKAKFGLATMKKRNEPKICVIGEILCLR
jgi:hypothetical protein